MLPSHQILNGFSDIKFELRNRTQTQKSMADLRLWFSLKDEMLYVHDYHEHEIRIIIAIKSKLGWTIKLDPRTFGHKLIFEAINNFEKENLIVRLFDLYKEYGTFR
jgi:hypothetical protein